MYYRNRHEQSLRQFNSQQLTTDFIQHTCSFEGLNCWTNCTVGLMQWYRQGKKWLKWRYRSTEMPTKFEVFKRFWILSLRSFRSRLVSHRRHESRETSLRRISWIVLSLLVTAHCSNPPERLQERQIFTPAQYGSGVLWQAFCLCVCVSVYKHISETTRQIVTNLCVCYPWSWLGPPLAALRYVM